MGRTIVIFTDAKKLSEIETTGSLEEDSVAEKIGDTPIYHNMNNEDLLFALTDTDVELRSSFASKVRFGSLHFVHHTAPVQAERTEFVNCLKVSSPHLIIGPGFQGEHNSDATMRKAYPYQRLAACLKNGTVTKEDFDDLWRFLNGDPILEELILLLKTHASKKAEGTEIGTLAGLKGAVVPSGQAQGGGNSPTITDETAELISTNLDNGSGYEALRKALVSAIVEREGANRRK